MGVFDVEFMELGEGTLEAKLWTTGLAARARGGV